MLLIYNSMPKDNYLIQDSNGGLIMYVSLFVPGYISEIRCVDFLIHNPAPTINPYFPTPVSFFPTAQ